MRYIVANWKSNKTIEEAVSWLKELLDGSMARWLDGRIIICAPFTALSGLKKQLTMKQLDNEIIFLGAQDLSSFPSGPYTGEISAARLQGLIDYVIVGHSERRRYLKETDETVARKIKQALKFQITPIVCLDEPYIENQILTMKQSNHEAIEQSIFAYEPLSAIGSGRPDNPENANMIAKRIKKITNNVPILYGGSVTSQNAKEFMRQDYINGLLVGKASLKAEEFMKIIKNAET